MIRGLRVGLTIEEATMPKPHMLEDGWLKRSIDGATDYVDRNRNWAEAIAANWQDDSAPCDLEGPGEFTEKDIPPPK